MKPIHRETAQAWTALGLTIGEFGTGLWLVIHDGHVLALYLAVTYLLRETRGGKHYHELILVAFRRIKR